MSRPEMYVNGERVAPPSGYHVEIETDMERARVYLARPIYSEIPAHTRTGVERFPIKLQPDERLDVRKDGRLVAAFVEHGGVAVDPIVTLRGALCR